MQTPQQISNFNLFGSRHWIRTQHNLVKRGSEYKTIHFNIAWHLFGSMSIPQAQITLFYTYVCYDLKLHIPIMGIINESVLGIVILDTSCFKASRSHSKPVGMTHRDPIMDLSLALDVKATLSSPEARFSPFFDHPTLHLLLNVRLINIIGNLPILASPHEVSRGLSMLTRPVSFSSQKGNSKPCNFAKPNDSELLLPNINPVVV